MTAPDEARGDRTDLLVTVASLYYELSQNQQQIADRLEMSRSSVSRMIKEARDLGIVEIRIHKPVNRDFYLEQALIERFGLQDAYVLGTSGETREDEALYGVGRLAAGYLKRVIGNMPPHTCIGTAWGTGAHAAISALPEDRVRQIDVVQLLGSVSVSDPMIDGPDVARLLAAKLGGRHYDLHAPALVEQPALRAMLIDEPSLRDGLQRGRSVALAITGIGTMAEEASSFLRAGHLTSTQLAHLREQGIVGETCGRFFDAKGRYEGYAINDRVVGIALEDLRNIPRVIAVARGLPKVMSILAALRGGYMTVLSTDDVTARAILSAAAMDAVEAVGEIALGGRGRNKSDDRKKSVWQM